MATSVVYSSIFAAVMASLPGLDTKLVCFNTSVVDLTEMLEDPVDVLFGVQLKRRHRHQPRARLGSIFGADGGGAAAAGHWGVGGGAGNCVGARLAEQRKQRSGVRSRKRC
jgi:hypothetical protein